MTSHPQLQDGIAPQLPHRPDAEAAVLGAGLVSAEALVIALGMLRPSDFFVTQNAVSFSVMQEMQAAAEPVNTVTLVDRLHKKAKLQQAGGPPYISQLVDVVPSFGKASVRRYCEIVLEQSALRSALRALDEGTKLLFAAEEPAQDIIGRTRLALSQIADRKQTDDIFDTWAEFQNAKPLRALIENFLWADVANVIGGLSGEGKTLILFANAKALLGGEPLFGYFRVLERLDRVVYLIPESARAPFFHRVKLFGLSSYLESGRLLVRTLSKGPRVNLDDPRLLRHVRDAAVMIDTAARFGEGDENSASDTASGLANDIFGLLSAGAACVPIAHHSPKSFAKDTYISLENVLRGSGDFGAFVGAGFGIRQIDKIQNIIHVESIKARDSEAGEPFQLIGRPWIDQEGDFRMHRNPGECGKLAEYIDAKSKGGASEDSRDSKTANLALLRSWLSEDPKLTSPELVAKFRAEGILLKDSTVRHYRAEVEKSRKTTGG